MNGFEKRTNTKRSSIRHAALALFKQYGIAKVSMNEIARQANVAQATLFNYFGSKSGLIEFLLTDLMDQQMERHITVLNSDLSFPEKTRRLLLGEVEILKEISFVYREPGGSEHAAIQALFAKYQKEKVMPFYLQYIRKGQADGHIPAHYPAQTIAIYMEMYRSQLSRMFEMLPDVEHEELLQDLVELFFYGLNGSRVH